MEFLYLPYRNVPFFIVSRNVYKKVRIKFTITINLEQSNIQLVYKAFNNNMLNEIECSIQNNKTHFVFIPIAIHLICKNSYYHLICHWTVHRVRKLYDAWGIFIHIQFALNYFMKYGSVSQVCTKDWGKSCVLYAFEKQLTLFYLQTRLLNSIYLHHSFA